MLEMVSGLGPHVQYVNGPIWKTSAASVLSSFRLHRPEEEVECILSKTKTKKNKKYRMHCALRLLTCSYAFKPDLKLVYTRFPERAIEKKNPGQNHHLQSKLSIPNKTKQFKFPNNQYNRCMIDSTEAGKFSVTIIYCITLQEILDFFYGQEILNIYHWQMIIVRLYRDNHQSQAVIDYTAAVI